MNVLVLNSGSSSLKFSLISTSLEMIRIGGETTLARGLIERIGLGESVIRFERAGEAPVRDAAPIKDHRQAIETAIRLLTTGEDPVVRDIKAIEAVGHRIVHGGEYFSRSCRFSDEVAKKIEDCIDLAPLHNPANLKGYQMGARLLPHVPHVAVFDTSFHATMPPHAFLYGIPYNQYTQHRIRRYGFHGTSHRYMSYRMRQLLGLRRPELNAITVHLGNGCSICAIKRGLSQDTTMGFTPLEGLVMGTRCGDIDPSVLFYMMGKEELSLTDVVTIVNKQSGLLGVSGVSNDMRELLSAESAGHERAALAVGLFCYRITKAIAAYLPVVGEGLHGICFTGGIGENSAAIRRAVMAPLEFMGAKLDRKKNETPGIEGLISTPDATLPVMVFKADEELVIARDTVRVVGGQL